jgi:ubiquinone/menaquinone biosynthesis C-methylase UbiE
MSDKNVFETNSAYWSAELNNEVYFKNGKTFERGTKEYFDFIIESRIKYIYYFDQVVSFFNEKKNDKSNLLEVGCGMGTDLVRFAKHGFNCTGVDLADGHIELARKLFGIYGQKATIEKGNAEKLRFQDESFDFVYSFGVIHHTPEPQNAIDEVYRVLKKGGRGFIMLYHKRSFNNLIHVLFNIPYENPKRTNKVADDAPYVYRYSKSEIKDMFKRFKSVRIKSEYLLGAGYGKVYDIIPRPIYMVLSRIMGWHLAIYFEK